MRSSKRPSQIKLEKIGVLNGKKMKNFNWDLESTKRNPKDILELKKDYT